MVSINTDHRSAIRSGLLGRDTGISMCTVVLACLLALATSWWMSTTVGADQFAEWTVSTWTGESPHQIVFLVAAALVTLGTVSAAVNSGLVPTSLLVAGPLFGAGLARYGTEYTVVGTTHAVSITEAAVDGAGVAIGIGLPLAVGCFLLGIGIRRMIESAFGGFNRTSRPNSM